MLGIQSWGVRLPRLRLQRSSIGAANAWSNAALKPLASGERTLCNWDEDAITMAVEAARNCLDGTVRSRVQSLTFASTTFPFADRQNSVVVAEALNLTEDTVALDIGNSQRAGTTALLNALRGKSVAVVPALVIAADRRLAKAASVQEMVYGDGAAAMLLGTDDLVAEFCGGHSRLVDFVDHYRGQRHAYDYEWEERWIRDEGYLKIVPATVAEALQQLNIAAADIRHFALPAWQSQTCEAVARKIGIKSECVADTLQKTCGDTGAAHPLMQLAAMLERAQPGELICLVGFGQGCDVLLFKQQSKPSGRLATRFAQALATRLPETNYQKLTTFTGTIDKDLGKRSELDKQTFLSALYRNRKTLTGFVGGACGKCGTIQFPKARYCVNPACNALDSQLDRPMSEARGRMMTWTADYLTFDLDPPAYSSMIEFEGGGRLMMDLTDVDPASVAVGGDVKLEFRVKATDPRRGFTRYFWKAVPVPTTLGASS